MTNFKLALASIKSTRWRSLFTILGVVIGVASVMITLSLGEGLKRQVASQINQLGNDLITVRSGKPVTKDQNGHITSINLLASFGTSTLSEPDVETIRKLPHVKTAVPISLLNTTVSVDERSLPGAVVIGASGDVPAVLNQRLAHGSFFKPDEADKSLVVIGKTVAEQLFKENVPIGKALTIHGERFVVIGVFDQFASNPLLPGSDFNSGVFIPFNAAKKLANGNVQVMQILVKPTKAEDLDSVIGATQAALTTAHNGQDDFTILRASDSLSLSNTLLSTVTNFIAAIAGISLFIGGIGIMNIMLVAVTERTHEIGIRKAVGASNRQILNQFIHEAVMLSLVGGIVGLAISFGVNYGLRLFTPLEPAITWQMAVAALSVSILIGIIFGGAPALQAARKQPIDALRQQ